jgi:hypothetical protein
MTPYPPAHPVYPSTTEESFSPNSPSGTGPNHPRGLDSSPHMHLKRHSSMIIGKGDIIEPTVHNIYYTHVVTPEQIMKLGPALVSPQTAHVLNLKQPMQPVHHPTDQHHHACRGTGGSWIRHWKNYR